jgi:Arc/MetJ family transcription regulator
MGCVEIDTVVNTHALDAVKRTSLNLDLDLDLLAEAQRILGTRGTTDAVTRALEETVRREKLRALAAETFEDLTPEALAELRRTRTSE